MVKQLDKPKSPDLMKQSPQPSRRKSSRTAEPVKMGVPLAIHSNHKVHIFGRNGQGKSKLAMYLFHNMKTRSKLILNSKPDKDLLTKWPNWQRTIQGQPAPGITHIARYLPKDERITGWDDILGLWTYGNILFYFDELPNHASASEWPDNLQKIFQTGRTFGDGAICCSQRPVNVPNFTISEAEHIFVFYTQLKSDREKLEGATGVKWDFLRDLPPYHCGYYALGMQEAIIVPPVPLV